jgi:hypothetical protein
MLDLDEGGEFAGAIEIYDYEARIMPNAALTCTSTSQIS